MKILFRLERETLAPYAVPGNILSLNQYDDLLMPWNAYPAVKAFPESEFVKHSYDREGVLSNGVSFFGGGTVEKLEDIENGLSTASMVTRWRAANPDLGEILLRSSFLLHSAWLRFQVLSTTSQ